MKTTGDREDLLSQIMETRGKHPQVVNDLVMHGYATTTPLAGADTVTIGFDIDHLLCGEAPRVAARLQEELDSCGLEMPPSWAAVQSLSYLDAVIWESFHCHPIGAMLSRRAVPQGPGFTLKNSHTLPPGTAVAVSGWATHFNQDVYGSDAADFRPERWFQGAEESREDYAERIRGMNKADLTWGHGDRACMDKNIARCEICKLMATLYSTFDVSLNLPSPWKPRSKRTEMLTQRSNLSIPQRLGRSRRPYWRSKLVWRLRLRLGLV